jgi:hypothetical protein
LDTRHAHADTIASPRLPDPAARLEGEDERHGRAGTVSRRDARGSVAPRLGLVAVGAGGTGISAALTAARHAERVPRRGGAV